LRKARQRMVGESGFEPPTPGPEFKDPNKKE
jgi:hypothetical protein